MYFNILKVLDVHNAKNFEKMAFTKPLKDCQYHVFLSAENCAITLNFIIFTRFTLIYQSFLHTLSETTGRFVQNFVKRLANFVLHNISNFHT